MSVKPKGIEIATSVGGYFDGVVVEAMKHQKVDASPAAHTYVVELLAAFAKPDPKAGSALSEPVTFLLRDAMEATGSERFKRLQNLGDGVLYGVGFFGEGLDRADKKYFVHVGSSAYGHAAEMLRKGAQGPGVLDELAAGFGSFVEVLNDVSDWVMAQGVRGQQGVVKLYERWLKRSSPALASGLAERGIMAPTGARGSA
ncbi:MAG: hypothetical protein U0414_38705 [Polyangiaceae bacterium]